VGKKKKKKKRETDRSARVSVLFALIKKWQAVSVAVFVINEEIKQETKTSRKKKEKVSRCGQKC
jgi:hypothetical protein